jgi:hypothetical protein
MSWFGMKRAQFKPGFRDIRWGDGPPPGMVVLQKDGEDALYTRPNDSLRVGEGKLTSIHYRFWKGKLHGVEMQVAPGSLKSVVDAITAVYGKPSQPNPMKERYYWMSVGRGEDETQGMIDAEDRMRGKIVLFSKVLVARRESERAPGGPPPGASPQNP